MRKLGGDQFQGEKGETLGSLRKQDLSRSTDLDFTN
jgi:hypothetical protein